MKKIMLVLLAALCLVSVLAISAGAVPAELGSWEASDGQLYHLPPFLSQMLDSFLSMIPALHALIVGRIPAFALFVYAGIAVVLLIIAAFGYRFLTFMRGFLGTIAGFFVGFIGWNMLMSWTGLPAGAQTFIANYEVFVKWGVIALITILGAVLTVVLRRLGTAVSFSVVATVCLLPCIRHSFVFIAILGALFLFSLLKSRASVIILASFGLPTFLLYLLVGPNGYYPLDLSMYISTVIDPLLLVGLVIGTFCCMLHFRVSRKVRA